MRLTTWNCCMGLHGKVHRLDRLRSDVLVIPECASHRTASLASFYASTSSAWTGLLENKGLGLFARAPYRVIVLEADPAGTFALTAAVERPEATPFQVIGVWAQRDPHPSYTVNVHRMLESLAPLIRRAPTVIAGDFNSCAFWQGRLDRHHAELLALLDGLGLVSAYHSFTGEPHGSESRSTYFHRRVADEGFHIDFAFIPASWRDRLRGVEVGPFEEWGDASDHCPITVDVDV